MATYKFSDFNAEIVDPIIDINPIVREVDPIKMTITAEITMSVPRAKYGITLRDIQVINLNYDPESLTIRVMERLADFEITNE